MALKAGLQYQEARVEGRAAGMPWGDDRGTGDVARLEGKTLHHVDQVAGFLHCLHGFRRHRYDFLAHEQHSVLRQYWDITQPLVHAAFGRAWPVRTAWTPGTMQALTGSAFIFPYPFVLFTGGAGRAMVEPWRCGKGYLIAGGYYALRASECSPESSAFRSYG